VLERTLGVPYLPGAGDAARDRRRRVSPGEADHLRRSMAAWRRKGGLEKFEQRLIDGMGAAVCRGVRATDLSADPRLRRIRVPESHSASFALIVYVSAWLKRYHPAAFTGALLNSLPMGFYAPSQLVQDARRHGVRAAGRRDGERVGLHAGTRAWR
jgi:error-prone DNA polymerase